MDSDLEAEGKADQLDGGVQVIRTKMQKGRDESSWNHLCCLLRHSLVTSAAQKNLDTKPLGQRLRCEESFQTL